MLGGLLVGQCAQQGDELGVGPVAPVEDLSGRRRSGPGQRCGRGRWRAGTWPVLEVGVRFAAAILLYERGGWARARRVTVTIGDFTFEEFVDVAPVA